MPRRRRGPKKPKSVSYELIEKDNVAGHPIYALMDELRDAHHHDTLRQRLVAAQKWAESGYVPTSDDGLIGAPSKGLACAHQREEDLRQRLAEAEQDRELLRREADETIVELAKVVAERDRLQAQLEPLGTYYGYIPDAATKRLSALQTALAGLPRFNIAIREIHPADLNEPVRTDVRAVLEADGVYVHFDSVATLLRETGQ